MEKVLFLATTESDGSLAKVALEALAGAVKLSRDMGGADLSVGLIGGDVQGAAESIAGCGAGTYLSVSGEPFSASRYATDAAAAEALVLKDEATIVLAPGTSRLGRALPGVAQRVDGCIDTHVTGLAVDGGSPIIERWFYRQRMVASMTRAARPWIMLVDSGVFEPLESQGMRENFPQNTCCGGFRRKDVSAWERHLGKAQEKGKGGPAGMGKGTPR